MEIVIPFALALALIFTANKVTASENQEAHKGYTLLLLLLNTLAAFLGLLLLLFPGENLARSLTGMLAVDNHTSLAWILFAIGLWGILCCLPPIRQGLSRIMPLDANSAVHMTALMLAGYLLGNTALALSENLLQQLSALDLAVSVVEVVLQQAGFVLLALGGTGLFIRRDLAGVRQRLGLQVPTPGQLILGIGVIFLLIFIQGTAGAVWALIDPDQAQQLGSINESLLAGFDSVGEWFILALAAGIGEEILFRGAIQPIFGLPITAFLFAAVHLQYGLTPITFVVFFLGVILGLVRRYSNTTVAVFVHFGYNFSLGLLSMLALYLEQFVTP